MKLSQPCAKMPMMGFKAVIFDFYGTVAEHDGSGVTLASVLADRGYALRPDLARLYWQDGLDGTAHDEHSRSREHYRAWQQARLSELLRACDVPSDEHDDITATLRHPDSVGRMVAYPEAHAVLDELRARGVAIAICSNWDWDLHESIEQSGLEAAFDVVVSSAWVGARKPHARIYEHTLNGLGITAEHALFVGDTWNCDVEGPSRFGMTPLYVRKPNRERDHTAPDDAPASRPLHDVLDIVAST